MNTQPQVCLAHQGEWLNVLGMQIKFLCTGADTANKYSSMLNTVPQGMGAPPHHHPWDELFYVLKGDIAFMLDGQSHTLHAGDYARVPANTVHAFTGLSSEEGLLLAFESPSHSHAFFREIHDTVRSLPDDLYKMPEIGNRYQVTFDAPPSG